MNIEQILDQANFIVKDGIKYEFLTSEKKKILEAYKNKTLCYERIKYVRNNQTIKKLCIFWNDEEIQIKYFGELCIKTKNTKFKKVL